MPTAGIEVLVNGKYRCLTRVPDNFFVGTGLGKLSVPLRVRLTSITGEQIQATIPDIKNDFSFPSNVQFKGIKSGGKLVSKHLVFSRQIVSSHALLSNNIFGLSKVI